MPRRRSVVVPPREIGQRLRAIRLQHGLSQVELARTLGVHQTNVSEIERGIRGLSVQHLAKLAKALKASPDQILGLGRANGGRSQARNQKLMRRVRRIELLPLDHQEAVIRMLDAFLQTRTT